MTCFLHRSGRGPSEPMDPQRHPRIIPMVSGHENAGPGIVSSAHADYSTSAGDVRTDYHTDEYVLRTDDGRKVTKTVTQRTTRRYSGSGGSGGSSPAPPSFAIQYGGEHVSRSPTKNVWAPPSQRAGGSNLYKSQSLLDVHFGHHRTPSPGSEQSRSLSPNYNTLPVRRPPPQDDYNRQRAGSVQQLHHVGRDQFSNLSRNQSPMDSYNRPRQRAGSLQALNRISHDELNQPIHFGHHRVSEVPAHFMTVSSGQTNYNTLPLRNRSAGDDYNRPRPRAGSLQPETQLNKENTDPFLAREQAKWEATHKQEVTPPMKFTNIGTDRYAPPKANDPNYPMFEVPKVNKCIWTPPVISEPERIHSPIKKRGPPVPPKPMSKPPSPIPFYPEERVVAGTGHHRPGMIRPPPQPHTLPAPPPPPMPGLPMGKCSCIVFYIKVIFSPILPKNVFIKRCMVLFLTFYIERSKRYKVVF